MERCWDGLRFEQADAVLLRRVRGPEHPWISIFTGSTNIYLYIYIYVSIYIYIYIYIYIFIYVSINLQHQAGPCHTLSLLGWTFVDRTFALAAPAECMRIHLQLRGRFSSCLPPAKRQQDDASSLDFGERLHPKPLARVSLTSSGSWPFGVGLRQFAGNGVQKAR